MIYIGQLGKHFNLAKYKVGSTGDKKRIVAEIIGFTVGM